MRDTFMNCTNFCVFSIFSMSQVKKKKCLHWQKYTGNLIPFDLRIISRYKKINLN